MCAFPGIKWNGREADHLRPCSAEVEINGTKFAQLLAGRWPRRLNFVLQRLVFGCPQHGNGFISIIWCLEFWCGS